VLAPLLRKLDRVPLLAYPGRARVPFTPAIVPGRVAARVRSLDPGIVHLHWIADGLLSVEALRGLPAPIVWTLHDSWAFTGGCHVPHACTRYREQCGCCPVLGSSGERDESHRVWSRKRRAWDALAIRLVAPSRWLAASAASSSLFRDRRCEVIPNGLDLERFRPQDAARCRERLGLPAGRRLILTGGVHLASDPNKGLDLMAEALRRLPQLGPVDDVEWVLFGVEPGAPVPDVPMPVRALGTLTDETMLASLYATADVCVAPSRQENLPGTVMEAMACGVPCVASSHPSLDEACGDAAVRADPDDPSAIAAAIEHALGDHDALAARGLEHARRFTWLDNGRAHLAAWQAAA
jgi:glycosyltransferase involved in cell wall biosynthesis